MKKIKNRWNRSLRLMAARLLLLKNRFLNKKAEESPAPVARRYGEGVPDSNAIPKVIWMYWDGSRVPLLVERCVENIKALNPDHLVHFLTPDSLRDFVEFLPRGLQDVNSAKKADWLRLYLLSRYGGVWLDATVVLNESLDWIHREKSQSDSDFIGFYMKNQTDDFRFPMMESWFMASTKGGRFASEWFEVFDREVIRGGLNNYLEGLKDQGVYDEMVQGLNRPEYLVVYVAAQQVQRRKSNYRISLFCADDSALLYQHLGRWKRRLLHERLLVWEKPNCMPPMLKLCSDDRKYLDVYLDAGVYSGGSIMAQFWERGERRSS